MLAAAVVAAFAVAGVTMSSGPGSAFLGRADQVVMISVPGLQWGDLEASETPQLDALISGGSALLSVRASAHVRTTTLDGYLTLNAGNRVGVGGDGSAADAWGSSPDGAGCTAVIGDATDAADDALNGAEPGALGEALHEAGLTTAA